MNCVSGGGGGARGSGEGGFGIREWNQYVECQVCALPHMRVFPWGVQIYIDRERERESPLLRDMGGGGWRGRDPSPWAHPLDIYDRER
jgi:hypothetical protein